MKEEPPPPASEADLIAAELRRKAALPDCFPGTAARLMRDAKDVEHNACQEERRARIRADRVNESAIDTTAIELGAEDAFPSSPSGDNGENEEGQVVRPLPAVQPPPYYPRQEPEPPRCADCDHLVAAPVDGRCQPCLAERAIAREIA